MRFGQPFMQATPMTNSPDPPVRMPGTRGFHLVEPNPEKDGRARRVLAYVTFGATQFTVETSPRRVTCCMCLGHINGHDEPRLKIRARTGFNVPPESSAWWRKYATFYVHVSCMDRLLRAEELNEVPEEKRAYGLCCVCSSYTTAPAKITTEEPEPKRMCKTCEPLYSKKAQRKVLKSLRALAR